MNGRISMKKRTGKKKVETEAQSIQKKCELSEIKAFPC